jgi:hypothetical protein
MTVVTTSLHRRGQMMIGSRRCLIDQSTVTVRRWLLPPVVVPIDEVSHFATMRHEGWSAMPGYTHVTPPMQSDAAERVAARILGRS